MAFAIDFGNANSGFQAGVINGPVYTEFHHHAAPEHQESPPNPLALIPFSRDPDFIERGVVLEQLHRKCATPGSRTALVGLGGVGKSQLAIEYAYRTQTRSPDTWVFWVHASNAARFEQSFRDIADCAKIVGRQNFKANIFKLVHDWLQDRERQWMLILDNVDDASFLLDAQLGSTNDPDVSQGTSRPLREYLPQCQNGSVLVTTRNRSAALNLAESGNIIPVEPMDEAHAMALLKKKLESVEGNLGMEFHRQDIAQLAAELEYMPLAIVQAAAYISERAPRCSVQEYLEKFRKSDRERTSLLDHEGGQLRRDWEAKNSIIITWQISFDHIRQNRPSAADLLSLMSLFDRQGIPEALLKTRSEPEDGKIDQKENDNDQWDSDEDNSSQHRRTDEFEEDVVTLRNFSFISINADKTTFEMHRLVQLATRKWLEAHGQLERWKHRFIRMLCEEFPTGEYENWAICQRLFPHAKSAVSLRPEEQDLLRDWASILFKAAWYAWRMGNGSEAETMSIKAMRVRKRILGQDHEDTLKSMSMVGCVYSFLGRWDAAEELYAQVMEICEKKLGADHPGTLRSIANLASTYSKQGRWELAEELFVHVIETCKKKLGMNHPDTLRSMAKLASTYSKQGRWEEAEELSIQVIETCKMKLGADHPDTLNIMAALASIYLEQGRSKTAEDLFIQVLETRQEKKLGADHPEILKSMANLASTYLEQGRFKAAEELFIQVVERARRKKLGADHPDILTSMVNLASTYLEQGRFEAAEGLVMQVLETRKKKLGADHPLCLTLMHNLAFTWNHQGRNVEAVRLMRECVQLQRRVLGAHHPDFISSSEALAGWEEVSPKRDVAEELMDVPDPTKL